MRSVKLDYYEYEKVCLVERKDFDRFWSELYKLGVEVKTKRRPTKRALLAPRKSKRSASNANRR